MAVKNDKGIKKSALDIEKYETKRDDASDAATYAAFPGGAPNPTAEAAWYSLLSADLNWQMSKKSYSAEEDRLVLDVCQKYWNVQKSLEDVRAKELSASVAELSFRRVQAMVRLGMTSPESPAGASPQTVLATAESDLARAKSDLTKAKNKLNSDYEALNQLLGLWPEDRPQLTDEVKFEPLPDTDLDYAVQRVIENSPKIWLAEEKINLARYAYESMWASGQYTSYDVRKVEKEQAEIDAVTAKDATRLATRGLYYTVRNLEAGIPAAEKGLEGAQEALRVAKLQFELGMITRENLLKAEATLADARKNLLDLKQQHAYMKLAFQKPWAVSSSGGSSAE
ncbi:MAG: TolC family protein [Bacillota bacterium]